ncbi:MAG: trypsin-like peptidase domain-containing protein [Thermoproteota archaeon]
MEKNENSHVKLYLAIALLTLLTLSSLGLTILFYFNFSQNVNQLSSENSQLKNELILVNSKVASLESTIETLSSLNFSGTSLSLSKIYQQAKNSVVIVQGTLVQKVYTFFGPVVQYSTVLGSGFVINYSGSFYVVTNFHVVDSAYNISVTFWDGDAYPASVIGSDPYSDLAVLEVNASRNKFYPLNIASSSALKVGDLAIAIGNPFGLSGSMTVGIVSQLGRTLSESSTGGYLIADVIQISTPINPGNSGGPLLNTFGQVIGITTAIVSGSQGVGFAVPSDTLLRELPDLIKTGHYDKHPWVGVAGIDMDYDIARYIGCNYTYGFLIVSVVKGSPAEKAGLIGGNKTVTISGTQITVGGDLIIAINGHRIRNVDEFVSYLERNTQPGQEITLTIVRDNKVMNVNLTLGSRP